MLANCIMTKSQPVCTELPSILWLAVYILTDDQDVRLGGLTNQTVVQQLLAEKGLTFSNAFVTTPVCCPSR